MRETGSINSLHIVVNMFVGEAFFIYAPSYGFYNITQETVLSIGLCDVLKTSVRWDIVHLPN